MRKTVITLLLLFVFPVNAEETNNDFYEIIDVVSQMKIVVLRQKNETASREILSRLKNAKPLLNNNHYQGHQLTHGSNITGFIGISYLQGKAEIAVFSTPPSRVRHATRVYKAYRSLLKERYRETRHNEFDLGDQVIARIKKEAVKVSIDVYRQK